MTQEPHSCYDEFMVFEQYIQLVKQDRRVPLLALVLVGVYFLFTLFSLVSYFSLRMGTPVALPSISAAHQAPIPAMHLFGDYASDYDDLPETRLQLTLAGTEISTTDAKASLALITAPGQNTKLYHIGANVPGGASIHAIQKNRVILNDNGELERLTMPIPILKATPVVPGLPINSGLSPA